MWNLGQLNELPEMKVQSHSAMILDVQYSPRNALLATSSEVSCLLQGGRGEVGRPPVVLLKFQQRG